MAWPEPIYSRKRVKVAGKKFVFPTDSVDRDTWVQYLNHSLVIENWRASHGAVLNNAQAWLRRLDNSTRPIVGQRLKRFETIVDKLKSGRSVDLSTMHDIARVRAIFRQEDDLHFFREKMFGSRALHEPVHNVSKYDYIQFPKESGYRGIHQVFRRKVKSFNGSAWNGLRFEVQLRTLPQHAWATAVEVFDSTQKARFKFVESQDPEYMQFLVISEMFARVHENRKGCLDNIPDRHLIDRYRQLESETNMVDIINGLKIVEEHGKIKGNSILQRKTDGSIVIHSYDSFPKAISAIPQIEKENNTVNAVLVGAKTPIHIRSAFRNYFDDTTDFIDLLRKAILELT